MVIKVLQHNMAPPQKVAMEWKATDFGEIRFQGVYFQWRFFCFRKNTFFMLNPTWVKWSNFDEVFAYIDSTLTL